jgi:hypothetical protein
VSGLGTAPLAGPWGWDEALRFLDGAVIPVRIGAIAGDGAPRVTSVWFAVAEDEIRCAVRPDSRLARWVAARPRVGFEVAGERPPYFGLRGAATAVVDPGLGAAALDAVIDRYLGPADVRLAAWLRSRAGSEVALRLRVTEAESWDYRGRMSGG